VKLGQCWFFSGAASAAAAAELDENNDDGGRQTALETVTFSFGGLNYPSIHCARSLAHLHCPQTPHPSNFSLQESML
jgi:hypothetical protein